MSVGAVLQGANRCTNMHQWNMAWWLQLTDVGTEDNVAAGPE